MRGGFQGFLRCLTAGLLCLFLLCGCALADTGVYTDEEGGVWDYDKGIYTMPDGTQVAIDDGDSSGTAKEEAGTYQNSDGSVRIVTEDTDAVKQNSDGSVTVESGAIQITDPAEESKPLTYEEWLARMDKIADRNGRETMTFFRNAEGLLIPVTVKYVGLGRSSIVLEGEEYMVSTSCLVWETEAPEDKLLAVINASREGQAKMRSKTKIKSTVLDTVRTNRVVRVLKVGSTWTFVDHNGIRGYIQTSSLTFYDNKPKTYSTGYISVKGKTPKGETVFVRSAPKGGSRHLEALAVATPLTIFSIDGDWAEIDADGWHCYILAKYVSMDNGSRPAVISAEADVLD